MDSELRQSCGRLGKSLIGVDDEFESMNSLIAWNISKVLETKPNIDLKAEIAAMQELLETRSWDVNRVVSHSPEDRHLACAFLAWQQLGHGDASSLYQFIQSNLNSTGENATESLVTQNIYFVSTTDVSCKSKIFIGHSESIYSDSSVFNDLDSGYNFGPADAKVVMRCEHGSKQHQPTIRCEKQAHRGGVEKKTHHSYPMSPWQQRLVKMDSTTAAMKKRVERLAKSESDRMRLILRAEAAWKNLERSYIHRLSSADEKEEEIIKRIRNSIDERSSYKQECLELAKILKGRLIVADKEKEELKKVEMIVCERVRTKLQLSEEAAVAEASLAQEQCRSAQYDRELRSKEDQTRRKFVNLQNEVESSRALRYEAERVLRAELAALKDQVANVSKRLLTEETDTKKLKTEVEQVRQTKSTLIEDLDECKLMCDSRMQGKMIELRNKTEKLDTIKEEVLDCQCKQPQDNSAVAKRTPSLAAICRCSSEDKLHGSCSCKSLRTTLLSKLLKDLFEGLQSEINDSGSIMPCELLKCLEDSHNWDRTSAVKTNLRNFFEKLLVGELDIAIASAIEKYHARWIGETCANRKKSEVEQRQQRALENRAQQLAEQLAEKLFQDRAEEVMKKAKNMMKESPPCDCSHTQAAATYSCILNTHIMDKPRTNTKMKNKITPILKEKPGKNIQNLAFHKTKILKKSTLKPIKERTNKLSTHVAEQEKKGRVANHILNHRAVCTDMYEIDNNFLMNRLKNKCVHSTRIDTPKNSNLSQNVSKISSFKGFKTLDQSYAVNLCLFEPHKDEDLEKKLSFKNMETNHSRDVEERQHERFNSSRYLDDMPSVELANSVLQPFVMCNENSRVDNTFACPNDCTCFNKLSSNNTLDNILQIYRDKNISYSTQLNEIGSNIIVTKQNRISPYHLDAFYKDCEDENEQKLTPLTREMINRESVFKSEFYHKDVDGFDTKGTDCEVNELPIKTKSSCKYGEISTFNFQHDHDYQFSQRQNVVETFRDQCNKCTNMERNLCDTTTSARSFYDQHNSESLNIFKNCIVDTSKNPFNADCRVDFLGVTLHDSKNNYNINKFTNKPSKEENCKGNVKIYCNDKMENEHLKIDKNKLYKQNNETSVSDCYIQNCDENMLLLSSKNKCVCCNKDEETCELEVNTFSLLMEYLQKKLEEYKLSTCKSSDISPVEAGLLFNKILKKVKKMILESSKELAGLCVDGHESDGVNACWRRACRLLQEYLRAKIKRLECSCFKIEDFSSKSLSEGLDKICKMIENDFDRLKAISKDTNSLKYNKTHSTGKELLSDTTFNGYVFDINEYSNVSSKRNSCKDSTPTSLINDQLKIKISEYNGDKEIVPNIEAAGKYYSFYANNSENYIKQKNSAKNAMDQNSIIKIMDNEKIITSILGEEREKVDVTYRNTQSMSVPCINYNVDCACDKILGRCTCTRTLKRNTNLIDANTSPSYILQNTTDLSKPIGFPCDMHAKLCEKEIETLPDTEMIELKGTEWDSQKGTNISTNIHTNLYENADYLSYDEWDDCESVPYHENASDVTSNKDKFYNSLLLPVDKRGSMDIEHINKTLLSNSDDMVICSFRSHDCECEMVPICHVKMLMDNIERKLLNYKCTCDSLHPSVCPAHSETVS